MNARNMHTLTAAVVMAGVVSIGSEETAQARIKLATLPDKEAVVVRFDHPQAVMVE